MYAKPMVKEVSISITADKWLISLSESQVQ